MAISQNQVTCISRIYDTVLDESAWPDVLERVAGFAGAKAAALFGVDPREGRGVSLRATSAMFEPSDLVTYHRDYAHHDRDPWGRTLAQRAGAYVTDEDVWPDREKFRVRPEVRWALDRFNVFHRAGLSASASPAQARGLMFNYEYGRPPSNPSELRRVAAVMPHLSQVLDLDHSFSALRERVADLMRALDLLRFGVCVLTEAGDVVTSNRAARNILDRRDGLRLSRAGKFTAVNPQASAAIRSAAQAAAQTARAAGITAGSTVVVPRRTAASSYILEFRPVRDDRGLIEPGLCGTIVMIIDPDEAESVSVDGLRQALGLSMVEASVAEMLVRGLSTAEIAEARGVTAETVKSQVNSLLRKADVPRRVDLVRLAMAITPPLFDEASSGQERRLCG